MKATKLLILSALLSLLTASTALAVDEGNTKPRMSSAAVFTGTSTADIVNQTSVSGNVKGVYCHFVNGSRGSVIFTVDGAATQTITPPDDLTDDAGGFRHTGWIPMNIRFESSIRVQVQHSGPTGETACYVSWALD